MAGHIFCQSYLTLIAYITAAAKVCQAGKVTFSPHFEFLFAFSPKTIFKKNHNVSSIIPPHRIVYHQQ